MRGRRLLLVLLLALSPACRSAKTEPEAGAVLVHVRCAAGTPTPDELRAWVYDDGGVLWDGVRIPAAGPLVAAGALDLGTVLIQPGQVRGRLRVHMRGLVAGARISDGTLAIATPLAGGRVYELVLDAAVPTDVDGDDVPDALDDCPAMANPAQGGCPAALAPDAGPDVVLPDGAVDTAATVSDSPSEQVADGNPDESQTQDATDGAADLVLVMSDVPAEDEGVEAGPSAVEVGLPDALPDLPADRAGADLRDSGPEVALDVGRDSPPVADLPVDQPEPDAAGGTACVDGGPCNLAQGALCGADTECASGFCADGVCCTNTCLGPCRSCNQPSSTGICQGYPAGLDPEGECGGGATCNGVGACGTAPPANLPNGQLCSAANQCKSGFCKDGVCCDTACDGTCQACGTGTCLAVKKADDVPECTGTMTCNPRGLCVAR
jgi:hypothetical protein